MHLFKVGSSYSSWKTHASRKHPNWQNEMENYGTIAPAEIPTVHCSDEDETLQSSPVAVSVTGSHADDVDDHGELAKSQDDHIFADLKRTAALFLLTFKEQYKLPQASIDFAVGAINGLISTVCNSVQESLQSQSDTAMLTAEQMTTCFAYEDPFSSLKTEYQQTKFYREEFGLVVSHVTRINIHVTYVLPYRNPLLSTLVRHINIKSVEQNANLLKHLIHANMYHLFKTWNGYFKTGTFMTRLG